MHFTIGQAKTIIEAFQICSSEGLSPALAVDELEITEVEVFDKLIKEYPELINSYGYLAKEYDEYYRNKGA